MNHELILSAFRALVQIPMISPVQSTYYDIICTYRVASEDMYRMYCMYCVYCMYFVSLYAVLLSLM